MAQLSELIQIFMALKLEKFVLHFAKTLDSPGSPDTSFVFFKAGFDYKTPELKKIGASHFAPGMAAETNCQIGWMQNEKIVELLDEDMVVWLCNDIADKGAAWDSYAFSFV
jgi:hypothetical protein